MPVHPFDQHIIPCLNLRVPYVCLMFPFVVFEEKKICGWLYWLLEEVVSYFVSRIDDQLYVSFSFILRLVLVSCPRLSDNQDCVYWDKVYINNCVLICSTFLQKVRSPISLFIDLFANGISDVPCSHSFISWGRALLSRCAAFVLWIY